MIIKTRYRDISFAETQKCIRPQRISQRKVDIDDWNKMRGRAVEIITPAGVGTSDWLCSGPFYRVVGESYAVCPHIAEIGD